jgi:hypothetical protein
MIWYLKNPSHNMNNKLRGPKYKIIQQSPELKGPNIHHTP